MASIFQIISLLFSSSTILVGIVFLYSHVIRPSRKHHAFSRQQAYRAITLVAFTLDIVWAIARVITMQTSATLEQKQFIYYLADALIAPCRSVGYVFYSLILYHRHDRMMFLQTTRVQHHCFCSSHLHSRRIWTSCTLVCNILLVVVCEITFTIEYLAFPSESPDTARRGLSISPSFAKLNSCQVFFTIFASLLVIASEFRTNYALVTQTLDYQPKQDRQSSWKQYLPSFHYSKDLKTKMWAWCMAFILSDILVIVLFIMGVTRFIPFSETSAICNSWLLLHVVISFKLLDMLVQQLKSGRAVTDNKGSSPTQDSIGLQYASKTDIVQEGLVTSILLIPTTIHTKETRDYTTTAE